MEKSTIEQITASGVMPVAVVSGSPFKNPYNAKNFKQERERNTLPDLTVPDQSLTVAELVYRFTHNMSLGGRVGTYDSDAEIEFPADWDKLDISEKHDWLQERKEEFDQLSEKMQAHRNKLEKEKREREIDEAVARKLAANRKAISGEIENTSDES